MIHAIGIDIGGSGIKGAPVDLTNGLLAADRIRIATPKPSTPEAVIDIVLTIVDRIGADPQTPVGVTFPAPVLHGVIPFVANLDQSWTGVNITELLSTALGRAVTVVNDADAAGYAEFIYGAAKDDDGTVIVTTLGTGIGSAIIVDGILVPNTELGHLEINGKNAESRASASAKVRDGLSYKQWAKRLTRYYAHVEKLFSPDLFVVGGGVSRNHDQFLPLIDIKTPLVPAALRNTAGIVGAARLAARDFKG